MIRTLEGPWWAARTCTSQERQEALTGKIIRAAELGEYEFTLCFQDGERAVFSDVGSEDGNRRFFERDSDLSEMAGAQYLGATDMGGITNNPETLGLHAKRIAFHTSAGDFFVTAWVDQDDEDFAGIVVTLR